MKTLPAAVPFRFVDFEQGSYEWKKWRRDGIGASDAGCIWSHHVGEPELWPYGTLDELIREKTRGVQREQTYAMRRGNRLEPIARDLFTRRTGIPVRPVCVQSIELPWLRASLDGWRWKGQVVLEIKAPKIDDHLFALEGLVPPKYRPQIIHQCLATGADEVFYFSYSEHSSVSEKDQTALVPYAPTAEELGELLEAEEAFWKRVEAARGKQAG